MTVVLDLLILPVSLRSACDIRRACSPICASPMSPSSSAFGTNAATESITRTSSAPLRTSVSAISRACSPVSGWEIRRSSVFTPIFFAYPTSRACSASIYAAKPFCFCASATMCRARVVLPPDSGPNISTTLPRGTPKVPSAISRLKEPVDMAGISVICSPPPNFMMEPLPNWRSICVMAKSTAFVLSVSARIVSCPPLIFLFEIFFVFFALIIFNRKN